MGLTRGLPCFIESMEEKSDHAPDYHFVSMNLGTLASRTGAYPRAVLVTKEGGVWCIPEKQPAKAFRVGEPRDKYFTDLFEMLSRLHKGPIRWLLFGKTHLKESTVRSFLPDEDGAKDQKGRIA